MLSTGKIIGIIAGTGLVGTASAVSYVYATSGTTIEYLLKSHTPAKTILTSNNFRKEGARAWKSYQDKNTDKAKGKDTWKLKDWNLIHQSTTMPQILFDKCEEQKYKKIEDRSDEAYIQFIDWCTLEGQ